jgi:hypothetical protein
VAEHGHQVLVPDVHAYQERGRDDQPVHHAIAGVVAFDLGDERVEDEDLDQAGNGQVGGGELLSEPT